MHGRMATLLGLKKVLPLSSLRWLLMRDDKIVAMYRIESEAVKSAIYFNDLYETDIYHVKKIDKRKDDYRIL